MQPTKHFVNIILLTVNLLFAVLFLSCNSNGGSTAKRQEDSAAKKMLQGTWVNDVEGNIVFSIVGDTIFYNDSLSNPVSFYVVEDTLFIENSKVVKYNIRKLTSTDFVFVNAEGDEMELVKSNNAEVAKGERKGNVTLNQQKMVKRDTVMVCKDKRYHAYTQVNPTTYKVFRQTTNNDGLSVESVYYDNIVYMALYDGQNKIFGQNVTKNGFVNFVPKSYLEQAVLSEIHVEGASEKGVRFVAVLTIPDSYTNYRVNMDVSPEGKLTLSL